VSRGRKRKKHKKQQRMSTEQRQETSSTAIQADPPGRGAWIIASIGVIAFLGWLAYHNRGIFVSENVDAPAPKPLTPAEELDAMLAKPDALINLTRAHFLIASEIPKFKDLDVSRETQRVGQMAQYIQYRIAQNRIAFERNPGKFKNQIAEYYLTMLMTALHFDKQLKDGNIQVVKGRPDNRDPNQLFVNGLFDKKIAHAFHCTSSMCYLQSS